MILRSSALALFALIALATASHAQNAVPSPPSSSFNWLNLNRNGNSAAFNYYSIVKPQFQTQNALMNVQQEYNNLAQSATNSDPNTAMRATGHSATFMTYGHYFPRLGGGGGSSGSPGKPGASAPRR